jgi:alpha-D-xyloside xylohydrolase
MNKNPNPIWFWQGDFDDGVKDPGYRELYLRWLQLGCFLPVFRSHGTDTPREIWNFGEKGDVFYDGIEKFIRLRYRLMPYIYSIAAMVHFDHYTMMRSLLFDFGEDEKAQTVSGEFLFGPALLVCPVTSPMRYGPGGEVLNKKEAWPCYLPGDEQTIWHDFWTDETCRGGTDSTVPAPLEKIPLFVRAGSIIPMETASIEYAGEVSGAPLEIRVYPGADGCFVLYEDSGDGYGYEEGTCNRINLAWNNRERLFSIGPAEYDFPQSLKNRPCILRLGSATKEITYDGNALEITI